MILFTKGTELKFFDQLININVFWSINKFKSKLFKASKLSTYDFSTLYTTLPHHLIKDKLIALINRTFIQKNIQYLACNEECAFFTSDVYKNYNIWSCQKVYNVLVYLLDTIFIRFETKLYRQTIGIPMGTTCAPLVADLFLFSYERDFMKSRSRENQAGIIEAFNSNSRYLDDLLNIDDIYFDQMVDRIYSTELQQIKPILPIPRHLLKIWIYVYLMVQFPPKFVLHVEYWYNEGGFDFGIVNFPFLDGDAPEHTPFGVYTYLSLLDSPEQ